MRCSGLLCFLLLLMQFPGAFCRKVRGRQLYIYTIASPIALIISKTVYNVLLMLLLTVIALGFYMLVLTGAGGLANVSFGYVFRQSEFLYDIYDDFRYRFQGR